jgi:hypothetical protein
MSQLSPQNTEQEKRSLPTTEGTDEHVLDEQDNMETEEAQAAHTNKQNEDSYKQGMTTGRRSSIPPLQDVSTKRDSEEQGMGLTMDNQPNAEGKLQEDTGTSPKRSKTMRVDRHGWHPQERSCSLPRRTPYKGKT